jgi:hypothetical protein
MKDADIRLEERASEHALIIANANRLLLDAKLLTDHARFASAFALAASPKQCNIQKCTDPQKVGLGKWRMLR